MSVKCGATTLKGEVVSDTVKGRVKVGRVLTIRCAAKPPLKWYIPESTTIFGQVLQARVYEARTVLAVYDGRITAFSARQVRHV